MRIDWSSHHSYNNNDTEERLLESLLELFFFQLMYHKKLKPLTANKNAICIKEREHLQ